MEIVPTEMELILEQTQQGISHEVSVDPHDTGYLKMEVKRRSVKLQNFKKDALLKLFKLSNQERCLTDESICYRCTLDVQGMSQDAMLWLNSRQILPPRSPAKSNTLLPSEPPTDQTIIMVLMVPYEAFACLCRAGDVVLRESLAKTLSDVNFFMERGTSLSTGSSTPPRYSPGASTPQSYSPGTSRNAECSNCKHLLGKITVLESTVDMYMHPEQHTFNSAALFHEVYNNMRKLDLE
nr:hypothetical protein [Tanacetum cinerariifolium]